MTSIKMIVFSLIVGVLLMTGYLTVYGTMMTQAEKKYGITVNETNETIMSYGTMASIRKDIDELQNQTRDIGRRGLWNLVDPRDIGGAFANIGSIIFAIPNLVNEAFQQAAQSLGIKGLAIPGWFSAIIITGILIYAVFQGIGIILGRGRV